MDPVYSTGHANEPITLIHEGPLAITQGGATLDLEGSVRLVWLPTPRVLVEAYAPDVFLDDLALQGGDATICIGGVQADVCIVRLHGNRDHDRPFNVVPGVNIRCVVKDPLLLEGTPEGRCAAVTFHIVNGPNYHGDSIGSLDARRSWTGRVRLEGGGWIITVDAPDNRDVLSDELGESGGYAITHFGEMKRSDSEPLTWSRAQDMLRAVTYFFSFARGGWASAHLATGVSNDGRTAFRVVSPGEPSQWTACNTWFFIPDARHLKAIFPRFIELWRDPLWGNHLREAIEWYVECCRYRGTLDGAVVLAQAALELLAWVTFVQQDPFLSKDAFDKLTACDKLKLLLTKIGVPQTIPQHVTLGNRGKQTWKDVGPFAFTEIRNAIVHPNRGSAGARDNTVAAWQLGCWYLDLALLSLLGLPEPSKLQLLRARGW